MRSLIRLASAADIAQLPRLLDQLGYPCRSEELAVRFARLYGRDDHRLLVSDANGHLTGMCHLQRIVLIASDGYAEVHALVVDARHRRQGIARALLQDARWHARDMGATRMRLRSGLRREEAHRFYRAVGYEQQRASHAFELLLNE